MERVKKLELGVRKYRRLRMVFRAFEAVAIAALIIVFVYCAGDPLLDIIGCLAAVVIIPESFLAVSRSTLKASIRDEKMLLERDLEWYSWLKGEAGRSRDELLALGSKDCETEECREVIQKEEMGTGWLSQQMKKYDETKEAIEKLESIKGLVTF
jgi:hypothetical protein